LRMIEGPVGCSLICWGENKKLFELVSSGILIYLNIICYYGGL